jgi:long-chain fatty acid transport protein
MKQIVLTFAVCLPFLAFSQGFQVSLQGQKQQGMGGAGTAYIHDGASLFYNPGGVSFLKQNSISMGVTPVISHVQYLDQPTSKTYETTSPVSYPFTGYAVMGKEGSKLKYGIAAYTPFGSTIDWEKGWTGRFVLTHIQLFAVYIQPTISYKISEHLGIGAGFVYSTGKVNLQRDIPVMNNNGEYGTAELDGKASGMGFNAGVYYKPTSTLSFGFTYRSEVKMDLKDGQANFSVPASLAASFPNGKFSSTLPLPRIMNFGAAYQASKKLAFAFDASMVGWSSYDTLKFDYEKNTDELEDTKSPRNYKDAYAFRLGAEYMLNNKFDLRGGIKYLGTPIKDGYVSPDVPDAININYSIGLGYKVNSKLGLDASFTYQSMNREDVNLETQLNGTYKTNIFMPGLSINYNF